MSVMTEFAKNENKTQGTRGPSTDSKKTLSIGISGKRYISKDEKDVVYKKIKNEITKILKEHKTDHFIAYTAIASGADTIFADVARNEFHEPLQIILPFPVEEYRKDFEGSDLNEFENLVKQYGVSKVIYTVSPTDDEGRNMAYYEVGKYMADETDEMIFIWDGLKPGGKGGTADIMGYFSDKRPEKKIHCVMVKPKQPDTLNEMIVGKYEEADRIAVKKRNVYRRVWKSVIFLGWFAVLSLAINTAFHPVKYELILLSLEFALVSTVLILVFLAHKKNYHRSYLEHRMKAETFRLVRSFYHAGVRITLSEQTKKDDNELALLVKQSNDEIKDNNKRSKWYSQYIINSLIKEQGSYHEGKIRAIGNKYRNFEKIMVTIALVFFINLLLYVIYAFLTHWDIKSPFVYSHEINVFFSIVLPATYAALEGFIHFNDWSILKKYSEFAKSGLKECGELLQINLERHSPEECHKKQSEVLNRVSGIMLSDNRNWSLLLENKDSYTMIV